MSDYERFKQIQKIAKHPSMGQDDDDNWKALKRKVRSFAFHNLQFANVRWSYADAEKLTLYIEFSVGDEKPTTLLTQVQWLYAQGAPTIGKAIDYIQRAIIVTYDYHMEYYGPLPDNVQEQEESK